MTLTITEIILLLLYASNQKPIKRYKLPFMIFMVKKALAATMEHNN